MQVAPEPGKDEAKEGGAAQNQAAAPEASLLQETSGGSGNSVRKSGSDTWYGRLRAVFEHEVTVIVLLLLLILDVVIMIVNAHLDSAYAKSQFDDCKDVVAECVPSAHRRLWDGGSVSSTPTSTADSSSSSGISSSCAHPHYGNHTLHDVEQILAYISIGILSIFLVEQVLILIAKRWDFITDWHMLDLVVVVVSLALEIWVSESPVSGILVIARVWRFARAMHFVREGKHKHHHAREAVKEIHNDWFASATKEDIHAHEEMWEKLSPLRWEALAKMHCGHAQHGMELTEAEKELAKEFAAHHPGLVLGSLARKYNRRHLTGSFSGNLGAIGENQRDVIQPAWHHSSTS